MKKNLRNMSLGAMAAALMLASCTAFVPTSSLGADATAEAATIAKTDALLGSTSSAGMNITLGGLSANTAKDQIITIPVTNGFVDVASVASAVKIFNLKDAGTARTATSTYARGSAVSFTSTVTRDGTADSNIYLTLNLDNNTTSQALELFIDPTALTGNSGTTKLDCDGDGVQGEAGDDDVVGYINVSSTSSYTVSSALTYMDNSKSPRANLGFNTTLASGATLSEFVFSGISSTSGFDSTAAITTASVGAGVSIEKFDPSSKAWAAVTVTKVLDAAAGTLTCTMSKAATTGDVFRAVVNKGLVTESAAVAGYTHKVNYNSATPQIDKTYLLISDASAAVVNASTLASVTFGGSDYTKYADVTATCTDIISSTLTADNVKVFTLKAAKYTPVSGYTLVKTGATTFRVVFPSTYKNGGNSQVVVVAYFGLKDQVTATDKIGFAGTGNGGNDFAGGSYAISGAGF